MLREKKAKKLLRLFKRKPNKGNKKYKMMLVKPRKRKIIKSLS